MIKTKKSIVAFFTIVITSIFLFAFGNKNVVKEINKIDYSGKNSLFIKYEGDSISFNWITNKTDEGFYQLKKSDDTLISEGLTSKNRVHQVKIAAKIIKETTFIFGGKNTKRHSINLYPDPKLENSNFKNVDSIFVVGDVHGKYDRLTKLLQNSNIIDENLNWIAGKANLVFLGDLFDRGNKVINVLWFIYELEHKAQKHGGKVHLVLGNHEIMVMSKDLRYISKKDKNISIAYKVKFDELFHPKETLLGNWLKSKASVLKVDMALFAHGGVIDLKSESIEKFNKKANSYIDHPAFLDLMKKIPDTIAYSKENWLDIKYFFYGEKSPYWFRGYANTTNFERKLKSVLRKYDTKVHVVGHTKHESITKRYKGRLITTDLNNKVTQLLLLVKKKNKYLTYTINSEGLKTKL